MSGRFNQEKISQLREMRKTMTYLDIMGFMDISPKVITKYAGNVIYTKPKPKRVVVNYENRFSGVPDMWV